MSVSDLIPGIRALKMIAAGLAGAALATAVLVVVYEGVPLGPLRAIPFAGPVLEGIFDGRVDRQRRAGALEERGHWQEAQRMLREALDAERRAAQDAIDMAVTRYLDERAAREAANTELEAALAASEAANAQESDGGGACTALSRGTLRALDKIGR